MARKQLNDLAKIGLGLAAAYGASKVLGQKNPMEIAQLEGSEADLNSMEGPAKQQIPSRSELNSKFNQMEGPDRAASSVASTMNPKTRMYGEPGSLEGFRASEAARKERIAGGTFEINPDSPRAKLASRLNRAKKGKMIKASTGGSVVARGNKLARSRPTKLF